MKVSIFQSIYKDCSLTSRSPHEACPPTFPMRSYVSDDVFPESWVNIDFIYNIRVQLNIVVPYIVEETGKREAFLTFRVFSLEDVKK